MILKNRKVDLSQKNVVIYADESDSKLIVSLGDLVRIIQMIPMFSARFVGWCSESSLFPLINGCTFVDTMFHKDSLKDSITNYQVIINLTTDEWFNNTELLIINIADLLPVEEEIKKATFNLSDLIFHKLSASKEIGFGYIETENQPKYDIGFNCEVPPEWKTKSLPKSKWIKLEQLLTRKYSVSWQKGMSCLSEYIEWISNCNLVISIVGLGCHLAMLYKRKLIVLSGPTDFAEIRNYKLGSVLYPAQHCDLRPCYQKNYDDCCNIMNTFDVNSIVVKVEEFMKNDVNFSHFYRTRI